MAEDPSRGTTIEEADPGSADALWCLDRYYDELRERFEEGFSVSKSLVSDSAQFSPPRGAFLIVRDDGRAVGCGGIKLTAPGVAYIKRNVSGATISPRATIATPME